MPRPPRQRGGKAIKRGLSAEQIPVIVICDRKGATFDAMLPKLDKASMSAALGGCSHVSEHFLLRWRQVHRRLRAERVWRSTCCPRPEALVPKRPNTISITSIVITAGTRNRLVISTASQRRTFRTISDGAGRSKPWDQTPIHGSGSSEPSAWGRINRFRNKSETHS